ncbi:MAG: hypothetical protein NT023_06710 [Armatimonadetes bacterium]|nr:hypothetical protein [Armatimonadota bacterium]
MLLPSCSYLPRSRVLLTVLFILGSLLPMSAEPPSLFPTTFTPGSPEEVGFLAKDFGSLVEKNVRRAEVGKFWSYAFTALPGARCRLSLRLDGDASSLALPNISVFGTDLKPILFATESGKDNALQVIWTVPATWKWGDKVTVVLGAKSAPFGVQSVKFVQTDPDSDNDGLPNGVKKLLVEGYPANTLVTVRRNPDKPYTVSQTPRIPTPEIDLQTDAMFVYTSAIESILGWKERGYTVWTMGGSRDGKEYADNNPAELQRTQDGQPITIEGSYYLTPTAKRQEIESRYYALAFQNGSDGICPEEPEYWARAGYEDAFKEAWLKEYNTPWEPPHSSIEARYRASRLMGLLEERHIDALLKSAQIQKPNLRRMVALHSPINYAQWGIIAPQYRISSLDSVQEVIGQAWTGTARSPVRYAGLRQDLTFSLAYLEYSSLYHLVRGTNKRLWFLLDPLEDNPNRSQQDFKSHYEDTLAACLLFPEVNSYEVMPWPERVYGHIPAGYATQINSVTAALQDMHNQIETKGSPAEFTNIGVLISDSLQYQRAAPSPSDFDGVFGLSLPLLQHGVPVQMVSLDRATAPNYLKAFKTLILSYDYQKPPSAAVHTALANWVKTGGSLLVVGGTDPYNSLNDSWWQQAKQATPHADLWNQLGITTGSPLANIGSAEPTLSFTALARAESGTHDLKNLNRYTYDITSFVTPTGSIALKFQDVTPTDGWGALVLSVEVKVDGQTALSFRTGSELENRFIAFDHNSQFNGQGRFSDGNSYWVYQLDNLPRSRRVTVHIEMGNGFFVSIASAKPDTSRTLLGTKVGGDIVRDTPRIRVGLAYPITSYPDFPKIESTLPAAKGKEEEAERLPTAFYTLRDGSIPLWKQDVGKGVVLYAGVAPGFFTSNSRSGTLWRSLVQYAHQRAGGAYTEPEVFRLKRGRYTIVRTLNDSETVEGRMIDILSPTLSVANERTVLPKSLGLFVDLPTGSIPRVGFASGRVQATVERNDATALFVKGPSKTQGVARLWAGNKTFKGVRGVDRLGSPISVESYVDGSSVLLKYPNNPDGVILRVGWE